MAITLLLLALLAGAACYWLYSPLMVDEPATVHELRSAGFVLSFWGCVALVLLAVTWATVEWCIGFFTHTYPL